VMKECPECKAEIDNLIQFSPAYKVYRCQMRKEYLSFPKCEYMDTVRTAGKEIWECPKCHATICHNAVEALNFLKED